MNSNKPDPKPPSKPSLIPSLSSMPESAKQVSLSIGFVIAMVVGAYGAGTQVNKGIDPEIQLKQAHEVQDIKVTLAKVSTILEGMQKQQDKNTKDLSDVQTKTHQMTTTLEVLSSHVKEEKRLSNR